jgi:hypothetical protein
MTSLPERLPIPGRSYAAFAVAGPIVLAAVAIAHAEGSALILDAVREDIEAAAADRLPARFGTTITTVPGDADDTFDRVHAICGAFRELVRRRLH